MAAIAAGTVATESRPTSTASHALAFRPLLLLVGNAISRGRDRTADDSGDGHEREQIRERCEQRRDRRRVRLQVHAERAREPEQQAGRGGTEWTPTAEDERRERDEPAPRRHVLREGVPEPDREERAACAGED